MLSRSGHVVAVPGWFTSLRITQLILAFIVLGLNAYHLHYIPYNIFVYSISIASATVITSTYHLIATLGSPRAYNAWAILTLDILLLILWLISFALTAALASAWAYGSNRCYDPYIGYYYCYRKRDTTVSEYWGAMVSAAVAGAVESVLFLAALITYSIALHQHRRAGLPLRPNASAPPPFYTAHPPSSGTVHGNSVALEKIGPGSQTHQQSYQQSACQLNITSPLAQSSPQPQASPPPQHQPFYHGRSSPVRSQSPVANPYRPTGVASTHNAGVCTSSPATSSQSLVSPIGTTAGCSGGGAGGAGGGRYYQRPVDGAQELQTSAPMPKLSELGTWRGA